MVTPESAAAAKNVRELSPNEIHERLRELYRKLEMISNGAAIDLEPHEYANLLGWMKFSVACSEQRLALMRSMAEQVPSMGYPKSAETMILALIENWFFEGDEKARAGLLEAIRKSVLDKAPTSSPRGDGGVRLATDDQEYHRTDWGTTLRKATERVGTGKASREGW